MSFGRQTIKVSLTFPPPDAMNQERINYRALLVSMSQQFKVTTAYVGVACCCLLLWLVVVVLLLSDLLLCCAPFSFNVSTGVLMLAILPR